MSSAGTKRRLLPLGLVQDTALLQQPHQAMGGRFYDPLDVGIPQGGRRHKHRRRRKLYRWWTLELCKVTTDSGHVGWGETAATMLNGWCSLKCFINPLGSDTPLLAAQISV